jgi:hypothetical protein
MINEKPSRDKRVKEKKKTISFKRVKEKKKTKKREAFYLKEKILWIKER